MKAMGLLEAVGGALTRPGTYTGQVRELLSVAACAARYPLGVGEAALRSGPLPASAVHDTPVVLVHGYGHNRSGWHVLERHLRDAGFGDVAPFNYNPLIHSVPELAERLAHHIEIVRALAGSERVHVVGHSLGGIILRWYVQEEGGDDVVHTAITVASPHQGCYAARVAPGETAKQLRPDSWLLRRLHERAEPSPVRWIAFYSNLDLLVPGPAAMITHPALAATNLLARDQGHLSVMLSRRVATAITSQLLAAEGAPGLATLSPMPAAAATTTAAAPAAKSNATAALS